MIQEEWRMCIGYLDYEISNLGRVRGLTRIKGGHRVNGQLLKPDLDRNGYLRVKLRTDTEIKANAIHRLIAFAFINNPNKYNVVNHKDGNKKNNEINNLEWCTHQQNAQHAGDTGLLRRGSYHSNSKLTESQVIEIKTLHVQRVPRKVVADKFNVSEACIAQIYQGRVWKHITINQIPFNANVLTEDL